MKAWLLPVDRPRACQQQEHTTTVHGLRFTLDFTRCLLEVAATRGAGVTERDGAQASRGQQQSLVADQISSLSREWRSADPETGGCGQERLQQEVLHLLLSFQPRRTAAPLPKERRAAVRGLTHCHGASQAGHALPLSHRQARYTHFLSPQHVRELTCLSVWQWSGS